MKIIRNRLIPFNGFSAINLFGILFVREYAKVSKHTVNHERIHTAQMLELLIFPFYLIYVSEWLFRVLFTKDRFSKRAYYNLSFEKEAYRNQQNMLYLDSRKHYSMWRPYFNKSGRRR